MLVCRTPFDRAFELVLSVAMIATGVFLFYGASRGRVIPFLAIIGKKERIVGTKVVGTFLFVVGALLLVTMIRHNC